MAIGKYNNESLTTKDKITNNANSYIVNKVYLNKEHNIYWYINQNGYLHILKPCKVKVDDRFLHYSIKDLLLTKNNTLKEMTANGSYKTVEEVYSILNENIN